MTRRQVTTIRTSFADCPEHGQTMIVVICSDTGNSTEEKPQAMIQFRWQNADGSWNVDTDWADSYVFPKLNTLELPDGYRWHYSERLESREHSPDEEKRFALYKSQRAAMYIATWIDTPKKRKAMPFLKFALMMLKRIALSFPKGLVTINEISQETWVKKSQPHLAPLGPSEGDDWVWWVRLADELTRKHFYP